MIIFPDTQFFLHFKDAWDIPWCEKIQADPITLLVCKTVQKEIEKHKNEQRGRPQDRARKYATRLAQVVVDDAPLVLRENGPRVLLDFKSANPQGWSRPETLDAGWGDDMIVADVLAFKEENPSAQVAILTNDPGLLARAKAFDLTIILSSGWELEPEDDANAKEMKRLNQELAKIRQSGPIFDFALEIEGQAADRIELTLDQNISTVSEGDLVSECLARNPKKVEFDGPPPSPVISAGLSIDQIIGGVFEWRAPTSEEIEAYWLAYEKWSGDLKLFVAACLAEAEETSTEIPVTVLLTNNGNNAGENVHVDIEARGEFLISKIKKGDSDSEETVRDFAKPPAPPAWQRVLTNPSLSAQHVSKLVAQLSRPAAHWKDLYEPGDDFSASRIASLIPPSHLYERDRHAFFYRDGTSKSRTRLWRFECEEFRHRGAPEEFRFRLVADPLDCQPRNGAIRVTVSARNLRSPIQKTFPIRMGVRQVDVANAIRNRLP